jgi:hypothetical protein
MTKRISLILILTAFSIIVTMITAINVLAGAGDPYPGNVGPNNSYFEYNGFRFEFVGCNYDDVNNETTCSWRTTQLGDKSISHLIVALRPDLTSRLITDSQICTGLNGYTIDCNVDVIVDGSGDPSTIAYGKFLGLALLKFTGGFSGYTSVETSVGFSGQLGGTDVTAAFIKSGNCYVENGKVLCPDSSFGPIQGVGEVCEEQDTYFTTQDIKKVVQQYDDGSGPKEYAVCLKAVKVNSKCYNEFYYACPPPNGNCNGLSDDAWCPSYKQDFDPRLVTQVYGEWACSNVIYVPDNAAYGICGPNSDYPECLPPPTAQAYTGGFANPCAPNCIESNFGGWPWCTCW